MKAISMDYITRITVVMVLKENTLLSVVYKYTFKKKQLNSFTIALGKEFSNLTAQNLRVMKIKISTTTKNSFVTHTV